MSQAAVGTVKLSIEGMEVGRLYRLPPECIDVETIPNVRITPPTRDEIQNRMESLLEVGQLQPIRVAISDGRESIPVEKGVPILVAGGCRVAAFLGLRDKYPEGPPAKSALKDFLIEAVVVPFPEAELEVTKASFAENLQRSDLAPMDIAQDIERLYKLGMTEAAVAKLAGRSRAWVSTHYGLLTNLHEDLQLDVTKRKLEYSTAQKLLKLPKEEQVAAVKELEAAGTPLTRDNVQRTVAERKAATESTPTGGPVPRTIGQVKKFYRTVVDELDPTDKTQSLLVEHAKIQLGLIEGRSDRWVNNKLFDLFESAGKVKKEPKPAKTTAEAGDKPKKRKAKSIKPATAAKEG